MAPKRGKTNKHADATLTSFIKEVCGYNEENNIFKLLIDSNYDNMTDIISADDERIEESTYLDDSGNELQVKSYMKAILKIIRAWNAHLISEKGISKVDWTDRSYVNSTTFDNYRIGPYNISILNKTPSFIPKTTPTTSGSIVKTTTDANAFIKAIKKSVNDYTPLRQEDKWSIWRRDTVAIIHTHGCANVIDPKYVPTTPDDKALFKAQQNFMYSVWTKTLLTMQGKQYVNEHFKDRDAQAVWIKFTTYMDDSARSKIEQRKIQSYLINTKYERGSIQGFTNEWMSNLQRYEDISCKSLHYTPEKKKEMLHNALKIIPEISNIESTELMAIVKGEDELTYQQYCDLVVQQLPTLDKKYLSKQKQSVKINYTDFQEDEDNVHYGTTDDNNNGWDEETTQDNDNIDINNAARPLPNIPLRRPMLPKEIYTQLSREDKRIWDTFSYSAKKTICNMYEYRPHQDNYMAPASAKHKGNMNPRFKTPNKSLNYKANIAEQDDNNNVSQDQGDNHEEINIPDEIMHYIDLKLN